MHKIEDIVRCGRLIWKKEPWNTVGLTSAKTHSVIQTTALAGATVTALAKHVTNVGGSVEVGKESFWVGRG